jgi:hypothetical protein
VANTAVADAEKDDPADVAREGFDALMEGKDSVVAGAAKNKVQAAGAKLLSEPRKAAIHAGMTEPQDDSPRRAVADEDRARHRSPT